ncbi:hypothetical protein LJE86_11880 [bacterium BMS3Abin03]|jgi:hypothetical protein|nr:hypothetical protein [bacterium BMS3Abin03]MCG6960922.1 hypothetical protein [bacterium BMS3Abin03]
MNKILKYFIASLAIISSATAQPSASFYFTTAFPTGEFKNYNNDIGYGGNMEFFFFTPSPKIPYGLGVDFSYTSYGIHFQTDPYSDELSLTSDRANNFFSAHILFQIAPYSGEIRPYVETLFGGSYIFSITDIGYYYYSDETLNLNDWSWSYGAGVGVKFLTTGDPYFNPGSVFLDLKVRYLMSTQTTYLDKNSIEIYDDAVYYTLNKSQADMITVSIGAYIFF